MSWLAGSPGVKWSDIGIGRTNETLGQGFTKMGVDLTVSSGQRQYEGDSTQTGSAPGRVLIPALSVRSIFLELIL